MNPLMFRCPTTGYELDIGLDIQVHGATLQKVQPVTLLVICPLCGHRTTILPFGRMLPTHECPGCKQISRTSDFLAGGR